MTAAGASIEVAAGGCDSLSFGGFEKIQMTQMIQERVRDLSNQNCWSAASALWNQRPALRATLEQLRLLVKAVDAENEMHPRQWLQLLAMTLDFQPDLIIELGRGRGNSTCIFTTAVNILGAQGREVVSICRTPHWEREVRSAVQKVVPQEWFAPLRAVRGDILTFDYRAVLSRKQRVLLFWDAHGFAIAECVLGELLPQLVPKTHLVIMHDMSDARYIPQEDSDYRGHRLWKGNDWSGPRLQLGFINSAVEQAVSVVDFTSRNHIELQTADHSLHAAFAGDEERLATLRAEFGTEFFSMRADWLWFTLNASPGPFTFPRYVPPSALRRSRLWRLLDYQNLAGWVKRLKR